MATSRMAFFGMTQTQISTDWDYHVENLTYKGYTVVEGVLNETECAEFSERLDTLNEAQIQKYTRERLEELNEFGMIRELISKDDAFAKLILHEAVWPIVERVIGETAILHLQNGLLLQSQQKNYQAQYHRDFARDFVCDKVLALNAMYVIDEYSSETGATWLVPFTHKFAQLPSQRYLEENGIQVQASPGSVLMFDSLLLHKAGENRSGKPRRAVNHMYTRPFIKQQIQYPLMLEGRYDMESKLSQVLGYWSIPPRSVEEYRVDPDQRTYRKGQG